MTPAEIVDKHLRGCLPPGVPPSYSKVIWAEQKMKGRRPVWEALLLMFDGKPGRVEVFKGGRGVEIWGHRWTDLPGGSCSYEGGRWIRIDPETLEPFPTQLDLLMPI